MNPTPKLDLDEALRQGLRPPPAPDALRARLLEAARRRSGSGSPFRTGLLAAAAVLAAALLPFLGARLAREKGGRVPLATAVSEASREFADTRDLAFREGSCAGKGCGEWALLRAGFRAPLPACVAETDLAGGGTCKIAGAASVHYGLRDGRAVFVFPKELEACQGNRRIRVDQGPVQGEAWNEQGRGYLLLARK